MEKVLLSYEFILTSRSAKKSESNTGSLGGEIRQSIHDHMSSVVVMGRRGQKRKNAERDRNNENHSTTNLISIDLVL